MEDQKEEMCWWRSAYHREAPEASTLSLSMLVAPK